MCLVSCLSARGRSAAWQHVWTKAIVEDQGGIADNVTVNIVCPGGGETNNEVIHLLKRKTGCLYPFIASYVLGQRQPVEGCKPSLCCGGSKVFKKGRVRAKRSSDNDFYCQKVVVLKASDPLGLRWRRYIRNV